MPLERRNLLPRKGAHSITHNDSETLGKKEGKHRSCFAYARERIPTLFIAFIVMVTLYDHVVVSNYAGLDIDGNESIPTPGVDNPATVGGKSSVAVANKVVQRDGFMVLGMHRSGTSMLTGLLYMAAGYTFGGHLHKGKDNPKGFFERFDVVGQNEKFMKQQGVTWHTDVLAFDWEQAVKDSESGAVELKGYARALKFFKDPKNVPWLQKDPRMCLALKVWLPSLEKEPAIVFTYRHPLEVASSLVKRNKRRTVTWGLELWIAYNMRAIQNSRGLCIVKTSNTAVLADPFNELQRISDELTSKCGVTAPKERVSQTEIDKFIDPNLQHHKATTTKHKEVLETYNDGTCVAYSFESDTIKDAPAYRKEREIYLKAMKIYCDLESGKAYEEDYEWPEL